VALNISRGNKHSTARRAGRQLASASSVERGHSRSRLATSAGKRQVAARKNGRRLASAGTGRSRS
jgi:hypothetical protein